MRKLGKMVLLIIGVANLLFAGLLLLSAYSPWIQPVNHPMLSCAGLTFPFFLFINICFLIFWLIFRQYKLACIPLLTLLLCLGQIHTYMPFRFSSPEPPEGSIKVISYNVMGTEGLIKGEDGESNILTYLKESGADIICLQEYNTAEWRNSHLSQKDIAKALEAYPYRSVRQPGGKHELACYSKFPILSSRALKYDSENNGSMEYELKIGADTLLLINNHLESNKLNDTDKEMYTDMLKDPRREKVKSGSKLLISKLAEASAIRAPQADTIAREVTASKHRYILVCGDFNDSPISYAHHTLSRLLDDAFVTSGRGLGISYHANRFYFRIDHILISKNLKAYNCKVDRSIGESDHFPITCYIAKKDDK